VPAARHGEVGNRTPGEEAEVIFTGERRVVEVDVGNAAHNGESDDEVEVLGPPVLQPEVQPAPPVAGGGETIGELLATRDRLLGAVRNLQEELDELPASLARDEEDDGGARQARAEVQCIEREQGLAYWNRRCAIAGERLFEQKRSVKRLTRELEVAREQLAQHQHALLSETTSEFFHDRFTALYESRLQLVRGNLVQRDAGGRSLYYELVKTEIKTQVNRCEALRIRALELRIVSLTRRLEVESAEQRRLQDRHDSLPGYPDFRDDDLEVFEVSSSDEDYTSSGDGDSSDGDDSDGTELLDERNTTRDTDEDQDDQPIPSTSKGSPKASRSA
jgi:hypothetical protein